MQDHLSRLHFIISRPPIVLHPAGVVRCNPWPKFYSYVLSKVFEEGSYLTTEGTKEIIIAAKRGHFDGCSSCDEVIDKWLKLLYSGEEGLESPTVRWKPLSKYLKVSAGRWGDMKSEEVVRSSPSPLPSNILFIYSYSAPSFFPSSLKCKADSKFSKSSPAHTR